MELIEPSSASCSTACTSTVSFRLDREQRRVLTVSQQLIELSGFATVPRGTTIAIGFEGEILVPTTVKWGDDGSAEGCTFEARLVCAIAADLRSRIVVSAALPDGRAVLDWFSLSPLVESGSAEQDCATPGTRAGLLATQRAWRPLMEADIWARRWSSVPSLEEPSAAPSRSTRPSRAIIVTSELRGPNQNVDAGSRALGLAQQLHSLGQRVTILFVPVNGYDVGNYTSWKHSLRPEGIELIECGPAAHEYCIPECRERSIRVYEALKHESFDTIHFFGDISLAHFTLYAKRQGLLAADTTAVVHALRPARWSRLNAGGFPAELAVLEREFMEREVIAGADVLVTGSSSMTEWLRQQEWQLPDVKRIVEYPAPLPRRRAISEALRTKPFGPKVLAFVGRVEDRSGIELFLGVAADLARQEQVRLLIVGPGGRIGDVSDSLFLESWAEHHAVSVERYARFDDYQLLSLLHARGATVIATGQSDYLPTFVEECIELGIPVLNVGAVPCEAVDELHSLEDRTQTEELRRARWGTLSEFASRIPPCAVTTPLISVCITHKDRPRFLEQALESVAQQSYSNVEVIIADDGSTDPEALALLDRIGRGEFRFPLRIYRQANMRQGAARNLSALNASGDYLFFLDDDNLMKPHALERMMMVAHRTGADLLTCALDFFTSAYQPCMTTVPRTTWVPVGPAIEMGGLINCYGDTFSLVKRTSFFEVGGFREEFGGFWEDWEFFSRMVLSGMRLEVIPEALAWYRHRPFERRDPQTVFRSRQMNLEPYLSAVPTSIRSTLRLVQNIYGAREEPITESLLASDRAADAELAEPLPKLLFKADSESGFAGISARAHCQLTPCADGLEIHATSDDPGLILDGFEFTGAGDVDLVLEYSAPGRTACQLFFLEDGETGYSEEMSVVQPVVPGENSVVFNIRNASLAGELRFDPGALPGRYILYSIEVRGR